MRFFIADSLRCFFPRARALCRVAVVVALAPAAASATLIQATYGNAHVQTADSTGLCAGTTVCVLGTENFDSVTTAQLTSTAGYTTGFGLTGAQTISGTMVADATAKATGNLISQPANAYGGAGGIGNYPELFTGSETLSLSSNGVPGVNYFGLWISALDKNNSLQFYSGSTLLFSFTPSTMLTAINARSNASAYYGNPNNLTQDTTEPFAFVNFFGIGGTFDKLLISNCCGTGFESDNYTVGYRNPATVVGNIFGVAEPGGLSLLASGLAMFAFVRRRATSYQRRLFRW